MITVVPGSMDEGQGVNKDESQQGVFIDVADDSCVAVDES